MICFNIRQARTDMSSSLPNGGVIPAPSRHQVNKTMSHRRDNVHLLLRAAREGAFLGRADLAQAIGITEGAISRLESGDREPSLDTLERWLNACRYDLEIGAVSTDKDPRRSLGSVGGGSTPEVDRWLEALVRNLRLQPRHVQEMVRAMLTAVPAPVPPELPTVKEMAHWDLERWRREIRAVQDAVYDISKFATHPPLDAFMTIIYVKLKEIEKIDTVAGWKVFARDWRASCAEIDAAFRDYTGDGFPWDEVSLSAVQTQNS